MKRRRTIRDLVAGVVEALRGNGMRIGICPRESILAYSSGLKDESLSYLELLVTLLVNLVKIPGVNSLDSRSKSTNQPVE